jgi:alpha-D-ribose 1-methylphosphonate 5-triphosphate synthase subunit PhnH
MNVTAIPAQARHVDPGTLRLATVGYGVFRAVNEALAQRGTMLRVPQRTPWPFECGAAAGAVLLSLLDRDSRLWIGIDPGNAAGLSSHLQWLTGCARAPWPEHADVAYIDDATLLCGLARLGTGSKLHAKGSSTLVLEVPDIEEAAASLRFGAADVVLTCGDALLALPDPAQRRDA